MHVWTVLENIFYFERFSNWSERKCCVTTGGGGRKMFFGSGIKVTAESSEYHQFDSENKKTTCLEWATPRLSKKNDHLCPQSTSDDQVNKLDFENKKSFLEINRWCYLSLNICLFWCSSVLILKWSDEKIRVVG